MRKILTATLVLQTAHALSLSSFQQLTVTTISTDCLNVYNSQISSCVEKDFTSTCSSSCIMGLDLITEKIYSACNSTCANPTSLLGIVLAGELIKSLCFPPNSNATLTPPRSSSALVRGGTKSVTSCVAPKTITKSVNPTTLSLTIQPFSSTVIPKPSRISVIFPSVVYPTATSLMSTSTSIYPNTIFSTTRASQTSLALSSELKTSLSTSTSTSVEPTTKPFSGGSGGGSPFDFQSRSSTSRSEKSSICAMALALLWVCLLYR
ncbi:hypothetical protein K3495_g6974 [Podosphaera aphanis]|nr:hypothetical protein K3495_g6974 [Podosphaera aphanis]